MRWLGVFNIVPLKRPKKLEMLASENLPARPFTHVIDRRTGEVLYGPVYDDTHNPDTWIRVITRKMGDVATMVERGDADGYERELVKVAAVCTAAVEQIQRRRIEGKQCE